MLNETDYLLIKDAMQEGTFYGSLYGTIVFHLLFFGTLFLIYLYINRKYGSLNQIIENFVKKFT